MSCTAKFKYGKYDLDVPVPEAECGPFHQLKTNSSVQFGVFSVLGLAIIAAIVGYHNRKLFLGSKTQKDTV